MQVDGDWISSDYPRMRREWLARFRAAVAENIEAQTSLELITGSGMRDDKLFEELWWCSSPESVAWEQYRREEARKILKSLKPLVDEQNSLLWNAAQLMEMDPEEVALAPAHWPAAEQNQAAETLLDAYVACRHLYDNLRGLDNLKGTVRDSAAITGLCLRVKTSTGRPHWQDIANLLQVAFEVSGAPTEWNEDALRKIFARYRSAHRRRFASLREQVSAEVSPSPAADTPDLRRSTKNRRLKTTPAKKAAKTYDMHAPLPSLGE